MAKILIVYYSAFGHVWEMTKAVEAGAKRVPDTEVKVVKIPEFEWNTPYLNSIEAYVHAQQLQEHIPEVYAADLKWADGIIWGIPTRYGMMPAQMKQVLDSHASLWATGTLEGKPTAVFTSTGSIHGGQETTILTTAVALLHFGMIFVGLPYQENKEQLTGKGIGGSPYGASTVVKSPGGDRMPVAEELTMASRLGERVAKVSAALRKE